MDRPAGGGGIGPTKTLAKLANHLAKRHPDFRAAGVCNLAELAPAAVAGYAAGGADGGVVQVQIGTPPFRVDEPQYHPSLAVPLPLATADTPRLIRAALAGLGALYRPGYRYQRAGVLLLDLAPAGARSGELFAPLTAAGEARREGVMTVMDDINRPWGRGTLCTLAEGLGQPWRMRRERLSPAYTTDWAGLPGVG